jgi:hypothetical protein
MGLDMYLSKKTYVQNWEHTPLSERHNVVVTKNGVIREDIKPRRITYVVEQIAYWRKFNALHGWIVENLANGVDECQEIHLYREQLENLLGILKEIGDDKLKARELMPPTQGFFFGSDVIDEYYFQDVQETIQILEDELNSTENGEYVYQASW